MIPLPRSDAKGGAEHLTLAYVAPAVATIPPPPVRPALAFLAGQPARLTLAALGGAGLAVILMQALSGRPAPAPATPLPAAAAPATTAQPPTTAASPPPQAAPKSLASRQADGTKAAARAVGTAPNQGPSATETPKHRGTPPSAGQLDGRNDQAGTKNGIAIRRGKSPVPIHPALLPAWTAFQAGDLKASQAGYQRAATDEPNNTDALHGLAAIALRQGRQADAAAGYQRILELNPQDSLAQSTLASLGEPRSAESEESHLQSILSKAPQSAAAQFALGNLYARNSRWQDAEAAYFSALALAPDNPDYRFNLAVSLDQLGQGKEAARHYRGALAQAGSHPAGFDPAQVSARLADLEP